MSDQFSVSSSGGVIMMKMIMKVTNITESIKDLPYINRYVNLRQKFLIYLYGSFLYTPVRERLEARIRARALHLANLKKQQQSDRASKSNQRCTSIEISSRGQDDTESNGYKFYESDIEPADLGLPPEMHPLGSVYRYISAKTILLMFIKLTIVYLDPNPNSPTSRFLRCYTPRFSLAASIEDRLMPFFTYVLCINHAIWRLIMRTFGPKFTLDLVPFLVAKSSLVRERAAMGGERIKHIYTAAAKTLDNNNSYNAEPLDILDMSMFFQLGDEYVLRPNRTPASRNEIMQTISFFFNVSAICVATIGVGCFLLGGFEFAFRQEQIFTNCDPPSTLDSLLHWYRVVSTAIVSLIYFFDAMTAVFLASMFGYLFTVDLLIYWRDIWQRLNRCYIKRQLSVIRQNSYMDRVNSIYANFRPPMRFSQPELLPFEMGRRSDFHDEDLYKLKCYLIDFFGQVKKIDEFVTILLPMALMIWQSCNSVVTISGWQLSAEANAGLLAVRFFQALGISIATGLCALMLRLKRTTEPAYPVLCSIVALDRGLSKRIWIRLLSVYTQRPRYAYTFLRGGIFTQLTLLKTISYTLTITVIIESMRFHK